MNSPEEPISVESVLLQGSLNELFQEHAYEVGISEITSSLHLCSIVLAGRCSFNNTLYGVRVWNKPAIDTDARITSIAVGEAACVLIRGQFLTPFTRTRLGDEELGAFRHWLRETTWDASYSHVLAKYFPHSGNATSR